MNAWTTLVEPRELLHRLGGEGLVVIDASADLGSPGAAQARFLQAHVPGALHADLDHDLSDHRLHGQGRHPWPEARDFVARLADWGIAPDDQVVVYDAADGALAAARLWWMLHVLGHERVAVLDGGWNAWQAAGLPVASGPARPRDRADYPSGRAFEDSRLFDASDVQAHLRRGGMLVDARAAERFRGDVEPLDRVAGHVPGAVNRPYAMNLQQGRFKPAGALREEFQALMGDTAPGDVVVMCGSGVTACHHLLAMARAGLHGAGLFTGSWSGWIEDPSRPVATGD
ncbi:sulfurtransferase [Marilutibacter aestuarii]|uniref:Sulfurtransferase n=1 Tax=Marilutibacter aestuarii TaxID=1706195 RepID=A0A508AKL6_9GAMM|nr:sulfurtransferase [Lysobacter aestuarii]TQD48228.1 sulfurtransferase [Lysobacter aestuarii]